MFQNEIQNNAVLSGIFCQRKKFYSLKPYFSFYFRILTNMNSFGHLLTTQITIPITYSQTTGNFNIFLSKHLEASVMEYYVTWNLTMARSFETSLFQTRHNVKMSILSFSTLQKHTHTQIHTNTHKHTHTERMTIRSHTAYDRQGKFRLGCVVRNHVEQVQLQSSARLPVLAARKLKS